MWIIIALIVIIILFIVIFLYTYIYNNLEAEMETVNAYLSKYCPDSPIMNILDYEWTQSFRENWEGIRDEYINYTQKFSVPEYKDLNKCASMEVEGWKTLFLRAFNIDTHLKSHFPLTSRLIDMSPCTTAYFSVLEPGVSIPPHRGIYKGVIRYHLGLIIPDQWDQCYLRVEDNILHWREGQELMFDDLYEHEVVNNTNQTRVILFLDIKRDFDNGWINLFNSLILYFIRKNPTLAQTITAINTQDYGLKVKEN